MKLTVRFSDAEYGALAKLAKQAERSMNDLIREAMREYLERLSD